MNKICFSYDGDTYLVELSQQGKNSFTVIYGKQTFRRLTWDEAMRELGACMMHCLVVDGKIEGR